jgi:hypothetical protein
MAFLTVEGIYRKGRVELSEQPLEAPAEARVLVTFLPVELNSGGKLDQAQREAAERLIARMQAGIDFGGGTFDREELYEERIRQLGL